MNNNMIQNNKTEVSKTPQMNDCDYISDVLESIKNLSNNLSVAINEASNKVLFNDFMAMFNDTKMAQRDLYNLMFKNGWYKLEKAGSDKIQEKLTEFTPKMSELKKEE